MHIGLYTVLNYINNFIGIEDRSKMDSLEAKILKDLGWSDEFMIPVANEENKRLASEVRNPFNNQRLSSTHSLMLKERHCGYLHMCRPADEGLQSHMIPCRIL